MLAGIKRVQVVVGLFMLMPIIACDPSPELSGIALDKRFTDAQLEALVVEAEKTLSAYPDKYVPQDVTGSLPLAGGVHVTYWRAGNRIGRGFSAESDTMRATREASWRALEQVKDPRRLQAHIVVVDNPKILNDKVDNLGRVALAVRSPEGSLKPNSVMPPAMAIEDGRSWNSVISRLDRWTTDGSDKVTLEALHVARNGAQAVTRRTFGAEQGAGQMGATDVSLARTRLVQWLRENQKQNPWGYPFRLQPWSGDDSIRADLSWQLRLALAATELRRDGAVTYFQHEADLRGIEKLIQTPDGDLFACLSCESDDSLLNTSLALLIMARSEQVDAESRVGEAFAEYVSKRITSYEVRSLSDSLTLAYAYAALREWWGRPLNVLELDGKLAAARESLVSSLRERAGDAALMDAPIWAELRWLLPDLQELNTPALMSSLEKLRGSGVPDLRVIETPIIASLASETGDRYFKEAMSRQYRFAGTYFCPLRYQCIGGVKTIGSAGEASAVAWWSVFMMLDAIDR